MERYFGYSNLILTNYLEFRFFRNGERYGEPIIIDKIVGESIHPEQESRKLFFDRRVKHAYRLNGAGRVFFIKLYY